jgi:hypothetical protein
MDIKYWIILSIIFTVIAAIIKNYAPTSANSITGFIENAISSWKSSCRADLGQGIPNFLVYDGKIDYDHKVFKLNKGPDNTLTFAEGHITYDANKVKIILDNGSYCEYTKPL